MLAGTLIADSDETAVSLIPIYSKMGVFENN